MVQVLVFIVQITVFRQPLGNMVQCWRYFLLSSPLKATSHNSRISILNHLYVYCFKKTKTRWVVEALQRTEPVWLRGLRGWRRKLGEWFLTWQSLASVFVTSQRADYSKYSITSSENGAVRTAEVCCSTSCSWGQIVTPEAITGRDAYMNVSLHH